MVASPLVAEAGTLSLRDPKFRLWVRWNKFPIRLFWQLVVPALIVLVSCIPNIGLPHHGHAPMWEWGMFALVWLTAALQYWQVKFFAFLRVISKNWAQIFAGTVSLMGTLACYGLMLGTAIPGDRAFLLAPSMAFFWSLLTGPIMLAVGTLKAPPSPSERGSLWLERGNLKRAVEWLTLAEILGGKEAEAAAEIRIQRGKKIAP